MEPGGLHHLCFFLFGLGRRWATVNESITTPVAVGMSLVLGFHGRPIRLSFCVEKRRQDDRKAQRPGRGSVAAGVSRACVAKWQSSVLAFSMAALLRLFSFK